MALDFAPVQRQAVSEQVAAAIRERILSGELRPGQRLGEVELASKFAVSRAVLREAFRQLGGEGLLVTQPYRGTCVWQPTRADICELFTTRAAMEGMCVRLILTAGRREELLVMLRPLVEEMAATEAAGRWPGQVDQRFHEAIVRLAGNRRILQIWTTTHPAVWLADLPDLAPPVWVPITERHRELCDALASGDLLEAQEATIAHVLWGIDTIATPPDSPNAATGESD